MFYVDLLGNLLSNLKLAFYENVDEGGFFSKMFQEGYDKGVREQLASSYQILVDVYDDILTTARLRCADEDSDEYRTEKKKVAAISQGLARDYNLCDIHYPQTSIQRMREDEDFYDHHAFQILNIQFFKMTPDEYKVALQGLP